MKRKHIVHVVESFGSGIIEFILQLTNELPHYKHTIIYSLREIPFEDIRPRFSSDVEFHKWNNAQRNISIKYDLLAFLELKKLFKSLESPDIIHLHSSKAGFLGRLLFMGAKKKVIFTPNGASFAVKGLGFFKKKIFTYLEYLSNLMSGQVVCVSKSEANLFIRIGVPAIFINNGIKSNDFPSKKSIPITQQIKIVTIGRISEQKNPLLFNKIALKFIKNKNINFTWVGDGELKYILNSPNIFITGWKSKSEVLSILRESSIYLSTSLWEGLPFACIEAMASGLPLVLYNCVGNIDLIFENKNGYLFEDEEQAILQLSNYVDNIFLIEEHGSFSKEIFLKHFTSELMGKKYDKLYSK
jgi:glycosyltransferase involved in cell wall biosynthesis